MFEKYRLSLVSMAVIGCLSVFPLKGHAAATNIVTDVFEDSVSVVGLDHQPLGKIPADLLLHRPVVGVDHQSGRIIVQTEKGIVLVKQSKIGTSGKIDLPKNDGCRLLQPSSRTTDSETPGLSTACP